MVEEIYEALRHLEDGYYKKFDNIYFPFYSSISTLLSWTEGIQKEVKAIHRQPAIHHATYTSIDKPSRASIDIGTSISIDIEATTSIDTDTPSVHEEPIEDRIGVLDTMQEKLKKLSEYAYDKLRKHQFNIECFEERLQLLSDETQDMKDRWTRSDEAIRSFTATWSRTRGNETNACYPTSSCFQQH